MNYILLLGMPGGGELVFIVLIIIMLFGSKKIPELARGLGKGMREIKNATNDIQQEIREGAREVNNAKDFTNVEKQVKDFIKEEKKESNIEQEDKVPEQNSDPAQPTIKPIQNPNTVQRKSTYSPSEDNTSEEA
jgi:sec-independent protein translocase protein TatA